MEQRLGSSSTDILATPVRGGRNLTTDERGSIDLSNAIAGWGSDLDPAMRPGVPRDKAPGLGSETLYANIPQQRPAVKIHKSTEHARLTPVFGTSCPPTGLSGRMRDAAYHYSEGKFQRWLTLMLADRVNVVEDVLGDLARLRVPNVVREMGLRSEWRYNRQGVLRKAAFAAVCVAFAVAYSRRRRRSRDAFTELA
jgi:hypothetical protein